MFNFFFRYLLPEKAKGGKQKTGVCRRTVCPKWEHTMAWHDISLDALWDRSLELTVWDHDRLGHNEILGGVRFNLGTGMYSIVLPELPDDEMAFLVFKSSQYNF